MNAIFFEVLLIFLLLLANGVLAMSEMALVAVRKNRLQQWAEEGDKKAEAALALAQNPNQFLATVQVGITLVGILAGAFGGATLAQELGRLIAYIPFLADYSHAIGFAVVVALITFCSLIIGELVPKRLALGDPERIASMVAQPMMVLSRLASPLVTLLDLSSSAVLRIFGIKPAKEPSVTAEDIKQMVEQGTESGVFETAEQGMIENVLRLDDRPVKAWMTPRHKILWLDSEDSPENIANIVAENIYNCYPVAEGNLENVLGIVHAKDILIQLAAGKKLALKSIVRPSVFIPESLSALKVLEKFREKQTHFAFVTNEYGSVEGLVTRNNILQDLVSHLSLTDDANAESQAFQRQDGSWLIDGLMDINRMLEMFDIEPTTDGADKGFHTVGGFVMRHLHGIPQVGQTFTWHHLRFEVVDMDGRRVDKVWVHTVDAPNTAHRKTQD